MRLFLDQNLSPQTTEFLRNLGHDILDVREAHLLGARDEDILSYAQRERRIVVTFNTDFADINEFPLGAHAGVIRLRIFPQTLEILHPILERELADLEQAKIEGCLVIIDNWRVRVKRP